MGKADSYSAFDQGAVEYDNWFERHSDLYERELATLRKALSGLSGGLDIGAGTGRFTKVLGMTVAVEPSEAMARLAIDRGITVIKSAAEAMPFHDASFPVAMMVTTVCFLKDIPRAFREVHRILQAGGVFIIGLIDKDSPLGKSYEAQKLTNPWYADAHFHSTSDISNLLYQAGFEGLEYWQTLLPSGVVAEDPMPGYGQGSFIVIRAKKS